MRSLWLFGQGAFLWSRFLWSGAIFMVRLLFDHTFYFLEARSFYQLTDPELFIFMAFRRVYSIKDQDFIFCLPIHFYFSIARIFYFRHPLSKDWSHSHQRSRKNQTTLKNQPFTFYQENLRQPYPTPPQKSLTKAQPPPQSRSRKNHRHTFKNLKPPLTLTLPHTHPIFTKYSLPLYNLN